MTRTLIILTLLLASLSACSATPTAPQPVDPELTAEQVVAGLTSQVSTATFTTVYDEESDPKPSIPSWCLCPKTPLVIFS